MNKYKKAAALYAYHKDHDDEELYKYYVALQSKEISTYIDLFIADEADIKDKLDLALHLALFSYACGDKLPVKLYDYLLENKIYYYGELYLRADEKIAKKLITVLEKGAHNQVSVNHLLCAISAIPCKASKEFFIKNSGNQPPKWASKLHVPPAEYTKVSGWCVNTSSVIETLYSEKITAFKRCEKENASPLSPVKPLDEKCGYCGQPLALIFDGEQKLAACLYCSCYETIFIKQDGDRVYWHPKNEPQGFLKEHPEYMKNDEELTQRFEYGITPSDEVRKPTYTAHQFAQISRTQIGGMPTAINNVSYPECPDCGAVMYFTAQFDMEDIEEYGEGLYYFFTCHKCGVHAVNYDQS